MGIIKKKSLGQNFLIDKNIVNTITDVGNIDNNDIIIEVGPGSGVLTQSLLDKKPKNIMVIEKDERLVKILRKKFLNKIDIINKDMLEVQYETLYKKNLIIFGNLPYNISTQILAKWIKMKNLEKFCKKLVLMFQKEVADRIIAESDTKYYGRLSILSQWKMQINKIMDIEPKCFSPMPKVRSTLLTFVPKKKFYVLNDPKNLEHVTNIFFSQRRKMVKKPMKYLFKNYENISEKLSIDLKLRPQNLEHFTYYKICEHYEKSIS